MTRKKFIDKKTAHRFHLVHRSQQDPRYHAEGGSKLILTPADYKTAKALQDMGVEGVGGYDDNVGTYLDPDDVDAAAESVKTKRVRAKGEVDEYGMPIDGYDYAKHMGEMGGGVYITKTGLVASKPLPEAAIEKMREENAAKQSQQKLNLPNAALASEEEYDRQLESITLREEHMDEDLRLALEEAEFADADGEEHNTVEDLDDDFMSQLAIANEQQQQQEAAEAAAATAAGTASAGAFDFEAHMERLMLEAEREDAELFGNDSEEEGEEEQVLLGRGDMDKHFDRVFEEEYDDEEMGELYEETEDPDVGGEMELDCDRVAEVLAMHMEAINIEDEEGKGILGVGRAPRLAVLKTRKAGGDGDEVTENESGEYEEEEDNTPIEAWGEYAKAVNVRPTWDCESIISTYSVVDNHPSRISLDGSNANSEGKKRSSNTRSTSRFGGGVSNAPTALQSSVIREESVLEEEEQEQVGIEEEEESEDPSNDNDGYSVASLLSSVKRAGKETPEEKRQRKQAVKEERRSRRMEKKFTKDEFKFEINRQKQASIVAKGDLKAGISTFKL